MEALQQEIIGILASAGKGLDVKEIHARSELANDLPATASEINRLASRGQVTRAMDRAGRAHYVIPSEETAGPAEPPAAIHIAVPQQAPKAKPPAAPKAPAQAKAAPPARQAAAPATPPAPAQPKIPQQPPTLRARVRAVLSSHAGPLTTGEIALALGDPKLSHKVSKALNDLVVKYGVIRESIGGGRRRWSWPRDASGDVPRAARGGLKSRVLDYVAQTTGALTTGQITEAIDGEIQAKDVSVVLSRLATDGLVARERLKEGDSRCLWRWIGAVDPSPASRQVDRPPASRKMDASAILRQAAKEIEDRAVQRDCPGGERSMARAVALFNALTGLALTEVDGWQFMQCLKLARSRAGPYVRDDHVYNAAYAALAAEAAEAALTPSREEAA